MSINRILALNMLTDQERITVLLLAGTRGIDDPVAQLTGVSNKVLAKVGGEPMISRVLRTLEQAETVSKRILCGPAWETVQKTAFLDTLIQSGTVHWVEPKQGPSLSVGGVLSQHPQDLPLLITTADHALLTPEIVDCFVREAQRAKVDVAVGLVSYPLVAAAYPKTKRTVIRLGGEGFCGCNLFALFTPKAKRLVEFWSHIEQERKHPVRLIRTLGALVLVRYLLGWLSLSDALHQLSQRLDLQIKAVMVPFPEAAIDVDSPEDLKLVEEILSRRQKNQHEGA